MASAALPESSEGGSQVRFGRLQIEFPGRELVGQLAVGLSQGVVGQIRKEMVGRVVAQAHRRPEGPDPEVEKRFSTLIGRGMENKFKFYPLEFRDAAGHSFLREALEEP